MSSGPSRRIILGGLGALAGCPFAAGAQTPPADKAAQHLTDAPENGAEADEVVSCFGAHQAGIVTPRPANGMIAAFDLVADRPEELADFLEKLSARIIYLTQGGPVEQLDPRLPPSDSGLLGDHRLADGLTITVSLGAALFDRLPWLAPHRPLMLQRMQKFPNDALDRSICHGDLSLQICATTQDTTLHALRDLIKSLRDHMVLRWKQEGNVPVSRKGEQGSARNFLGFRDGSANPDTTDQALMDRVLWCGSAEPAWAQGGCYQVVRIIRNFVERWDRTPLGEQEMIIGRTRVSGAPLQDRAADEFTLPDYTRDPEGSLTPLDAHIRLANPRDAESLSHPMLRRPFNYSNGASKSGQLEMGLLFISYHADVEKGFIAVQNRLNGEPLEEYIKPVGGGYFFTLPGMKDPTDTLGRQLILAASSPL